MYDTTTLISMRLLITTLIASLALSLLAGWAALQWIHAPISIVGSFVMLTLSKNPGIAFSIALGSPWQEILITAALSGVVFVAVRSKKTRLASVAFGLIIGGALANLIDRMIHGFVTDFIALGTFPVFNLADSCL